MIDPMIRSLPQQSVFPSRPQVLPGPATQSLARPAADQWLPNSPADSGATQNLNFESHLTGAQSVTGKTLPRKEKDQTQDSADFAIDPALLALISFPGKPSPLPEPSLGEISGSKIGTTDVQGQLGQAGSKAFNVPSLKTLPEGTSQDPNKVGSEVSRTSLQSLADSSKSGKVNLLDQLGRPNGSTLEGSSVQNTGNEGKVQLESIINTITLNSPPIFEERSVPSQSPNFGMDPGFVQQDLLGQNAQVQSIQLNSNPMLATQVLGATSLSGRDFLSTLEQIKGPAQRISRESEVPKFSYLDGTAMKPEGVLPLAGDPLKQVQGVGSLSRQGHAADSVSDLRKKLTGNQLQEGLLGEGQFGAQNLNQLAGQSTSTSNPVVNLSAQVTVGAGAKSRLSSESLINVGSEIRNLMAKGGGEIRVRLRPENLGEMNIRVMTQGTRVGVQIQAADERVRKMIEDSVGSLKEALSAQKLTLSQLDLSVISGPKHADNANQNQSQMGHPDMGSLDFNQGLFQQNQGNRPGFSFDGSELERFEGGRSRPSASLGQSSSSGPGRFGMMRGNVSAGRIDVTA
ncbi:MAG: flagellar hook-length control protein FliK [Bdellovibrio sp.]|nr:flagellar hook-length control protein FliK [Bdellovibrio sp.]